MSSMFRGATSFNQPLNHWDTSAIEGMVATFQDATAFNQPLDGWDTSSVVSMLAMFYYAPAFNQPLKETLIYYNLKYRM